LGGKVFGIFLTGVAQMLILIVASSLIFQLKWGDALGVLLLVLAAVFAATGWTSYPRRAYWSASQRSSLPWASGDFDTNKAKVKVPPSSGTFCWVKMNSSRPRQR
jgi:hypothetical protein